MVGAVRSAMGVGVGVVGRVKVQVQVPVVLLALCGRAEGCVGVGDLDKALGGVWIGGVAVWVVGFG